MDSLHEKVQKCINRLGADRLKLPAFFNFPFGLRFRIGTPFSAVYISGRTNRLTLNDVYFEDVQKKTTGIYESLPAAPDILEFDIFPCDDNFSAFIERFREISGLAEPDEVVNDQLRLDCAVLPLIRLYWDISGVKLNYSSLLGEIIRADFDGFSQLASSVYFWSCSSSFMFYINDDHGTDIVAEKAQTLYGLYKKYGKWIPDFDRKQIEPNFMACEAADEG